MRRITPWLPRYEIACRLTRRRNEIHYKRRLSNYFPIKEENLKRKKLKLRNSTPLLRERLSVRNSNCDNLFGIFLS